MGFLKKISIKSVGNFVSDNVKSTVKDSARIAQQYINNPVTKSVAPLALQAIGVPPQVYNVVSNLQNKGLNSLQGIKDEVASGEYSEYSEEIKGLSEEQYKQIVKTIDDEKKQKEEELKKKNRNKIYILVGGVFLIATVIFVTYKIAKKK
jgi:hypothetical protein